MTSPTLTRNEPFGLILEAPAPQAPLAELDVEHLRQLLWQERLLVLRGFESFPSAEAFAAWCEGWGEISIWPFGKVLELKEQPNPEDHIFDNNYVPLHWDGMYRPQVAEFQIFHCVEAPKAGQGGRTTFSDTVRALEGAAPETRALWESATGSYRRKMEFYDSHTVSPIVDRHPFRGHAVIRYNEPPQAGYGDFLNPPILEFSGFPESQREAFFTSLNEALYAPANFYAHEWQAGDVVVADNFSLLHGREGFESKAPRHLRRVHVLSNPPLDNPRLVSHR